MKKMWGILLIACCALFLAGCHQQKDKDHVTIGVTSLINKIDPTNSGDPWSLTSDGISETLYTQDKDGKLVSHLVKSLSQTGPLTWQMTLKSGVKFSNGSPVTAQVVADCMNQIMEKNKNARDSAGKLTFKAEGKDVVNITTERETKVMKSILAEWTNIIYKKDGKSYVFTGPYYVKRFDPGKSLVLAPNQYYDDNANKRPDVTLKVFKDTSAMKQAFEAHEIDMAFTVTPAIAKQLTKQGEVVKQIDAGYQYFALVNTNKEPLNDQNVRQAVSLAMDRQAMVKQLGGGRVATGFFAHYYGFDSNLKLHQDLKAARQALAKAGYTTKNKDGYVTKDGHPLELTITTYNARPDLPTIAQEAVSDLKKVGIKAHVKLVDNIDTTAEKRNYDLIFYAQHTAPTGEPSHALSMFLRSDSSKNVMGYSNPDVDAMIDELMKTDQDDPKRNQLAKKIQNQAAKDLPVIYLVDPQWHVAVSQSLKDYQPFCGDYYIVNPSLRKPN